MKKLPQIGQLKTRIAIVNRFLTPDEGVSLFDNREVIFKTYAHKEPLNLAKASQAMAFYNFQSDIGDAPTHTFTMRNPPDMMMSIKNWIFGEFRYGYQWFQVMGVIPIDEDEEWIKVYARIDQTKDTRADPVIHTMTDNFIEVDLDDHS